MATTAIIHVTPELQIHHYGEFDVLHHKGHSVQLAQGEAFRLLDSLSFCLGLHAQILEIRQGNDGEGDMIELNPEEQEALYLTLNSLKELAEEDDEDGGL